METLLNMKGSTFLKSSAVLCFFLCGLCVFPPCSFAAERPNVLFIAIDDLNDWIGCLGGHPQIETPRIDELAQRGVLFANAHCQAPICNPSRVSLLTGVLPSTSGIYDLDQPHHLAPVLAGAVTLPAHFKANGYHVMGRGKIYHGAYKYPEDWDDFSTGSDPRRSAVKKRPISSLPGVGVRDFGPIDLPEEEMGDMSNSLWAAERLGETYEKPFFLAVGIRLPHVPLYAPRAYFENYAAESVILPEVREDDLDDLPPAGIKITRYMHSTPMNHEAILEHGEWENAVSAYLACVAFVDACVGKMLDALDASEHAQNTVVVLWSDHGWHLGEKEHWAKRSLWEESTRVPLIFAGPGITAPGGVSPRAVGLIDLFPTLDELCGLPSPPQELEGRSIVSLLENPLAKWQHPVLTTFNRGDHSLRTDRWRYIRYSNGDEELYDHDTDPNEWENLATNPEYASHLVRFRRQLPSTDAENAPRKERKKK